jgi:hypothetical protein
VVGGGQGRRALCTDGIRRRAEDVAPGRGALPAVDPIRWPEDGSAAVMTAEDLPPMDLGTSTATCDRAIVPAELVGFYVFARRTLPLCSNS